MSCGNYFYTDPYKAFLSNWIGLILFRVCISRISQLYFASVFTNSILLYHKKLLNELVYQYQVRIHHFRSLSKFCAPVINMRAVLQSASIIEYFVRGNRCYLPGNCAETNDDHSMARWPRIFEKFFILSLTLKFFHQYFLFLYQRAPSSPPPL